MLELRTGVQYGHRIVVFKNSAGKWQRLLKTADIKAMGYTVNRFNKELKISKITPSQLELLTTESVLRLIGLQN